MTREDWALFGHWARRIYRYILVILSPQEENFNDLIWNRK